MMIKNVYFWINIVLLLGVSIGIFLLNSLNKSVNVPQELVLKNGDLILRRGKSTESYMVILADSKTNFSHIGIICIENDTPYVIHAVPHQKNFIKKDKLTHFLSPKNASTFSVYRSKLSPSTQNKIAFEAMVFYKNKYIFDSDFDLTTNTKLYCTELVLKAYKNAGIQLNIQLKEFNYLIGKQAVILPSEFTNHPFFYKVI